MGNLLAAGGEDIDFDLTGSVSIVNGVKRTNWARGVLRLTGSTSDPPPNRIGKSLSGAASSFWVHAQANVSSLSTSSGAQMCRVLDSGTCRLVVRGTGTAGQLKISKRTSAGAFTDLVTSSSGVWPDTNGPYAFDLFIDYAVAGRVTLYINGVQVADFSGDVTTDSATTLDSVEFSGPLSGGTVDWSEVIVHQDDTRGMGLLLQNPSAAGTNQTWTGTSGSVNKQLASDTSSISTATDNALSGWLPGFSVPPGEWDLDSIVQSMRAEVGTTGPQHLAWYLRVGGTDETTGSVAPTTSFGNFANQIWLTNPATGLAWDIGDLTGLEFGVESLA